MTRCQSSQTVGQNLFDKAVSSLREHCGFTRMGYIFRAGF